METHGLLLEEHILLKSSNDAGLCFLLNTYYNTYGRFYHNSRHITDCIESYKKLIIDQSVDLLYRNELFIAILFHDIIYNVKSPLGENEQKSADFCLGVGPGFWESHMDDVSSIDWKIVEQIIMSTVHSGGNIDLLEARYMINIDLMSISTSHHASHATSIRNEYIQAYTPNEYTIGRQQFLKNFIGRDKIYYPLDNKINDLIFDVLKTQAKINLSSELSSIEAENKF